MPIPLSHYQREYGAYGEARSTYGEGSCPTRSVLHCVWVFDVRRIYLCLIFTICLAAFVCSISSYPPTFGVRRCISNSPGDRLPVFVSDVSFMLCRGLSPQSSHLSGMQSARTLDACWIFMGRLLFYMYDRTTPETQTRIAYCVGAYPRRPETNHNNCYLIQGTI